MNANYRAEYINQQFILLKETARVFSYKVSCLDTKYLRSAFYCVSLIEFLLDHICSMIFHFECVVFHQGFVLFLVLLCGPAIHWVGNQLGLKFRQTEIKYGETSPVVSS